MSKETLILSNHLLFRLVQKIVQLMHRTFNRKIELPNKVSCNSGSASWEREEYTMTFRPKMHDALYKVRIKT